MRLPKITSIQFVYASVICSITSYFLYLYNILWYKQNVLTIQHIISPCFWKKKKTIRTNKHFLKLISASLEYYACIFPLKQWAYEACNDDDYNATANDDDGTE